MSFLFIMGIVITFIVGPLLLCWIDYEIDPLKKNDSEWEDYIKREGIEEE